MEGSSDGTWSRALMASSGLPVHGNGTVRHASAEEREAAMDGTPSVRLRELSVCKDPAVREAVARRRDCPFGALASLAHDRRDDVRVAVAANPSASRAILEHLLGDRHSSVLCALARNPGTPRDLLEALAVHRRPEVRRVAGRQLDELHEAIGAPTEATTPLPPELRERGTITAVRTPLGNLPGAVVPREGFTAPRPSVPPPRLAAPAPTGAWLPSQ
jgi:hypothetical protein